TFAGSDLNEVGAALVYPLVIALDDSPIIPGGGPYETYATITNASEDAVFAHISLINGDSDDDEYCYECDFTIPLSGNDTEMLILRNDAVGGTVIEGEPDGNGLNYFQHSCPISFGMLVVTLENAAGDSVTDNVLLGEQVLVNYNFGFAMSIPAISFQGQNGGNGDRKFGFDDVEYGKLPRIIATDFIAPNLAPNRIRADLALFTLNFRRQFPPFVDCSVTGFDADENPFSRSIQFGCWDIFELQDISPEFLQPNLGLFNQGDTHGWLQLNCETVNGYTLATAAGGVHGALMQRLLAGSVVRRNDQNAPAIPGGNQAAFSRLLYQSVTTGDPLTLDLEAEANSAGGLF
ncbi:MAG: hypothetical protein GY722_04865, partial [bacterium]|nr:hypothetical protein [bacterium]